MPLSVPENIYLVLTKEGVYHTVEMSVIRYELTKEAAIRAYYMHAMCNITLNLKDAAGIMKETNETGEVCSNCLAALRRT